MTGRQQFPAHFGTTEICSEREAGTKPHYRRSGGVVARMALIRLAVFLSALLAVSNAFAVELGDPGEALSVNIHGFASQGFILTSRNNFLAKSKKGSVEFSEIGLNFTVPINDKLRVGMQLFSRDLGPIGDYNIKADWYYLDYRFADWFGLRVGRTKLPFGLYNESSDADSARVPVLLPQSIYQIQSRDFLLAQTGAEIYGRVTTGSAGALEYRFYGGTVFLQQRTSSSALTLQELTVPYIVGGRLLWEAPLEGLRLAASLQALRLDGTLQVAATKSIVQFELPAVLWVASMEYAKDDLLLAAEYSRWHIKTRSTDPASFPEVSQVSERAYGMASYRVNKWFHPGTYYSVLYRDVDKREGPSGSQHDVALTMRYDLTSHWLLKLEGHCMYGTAGLDSSLNNNVPLDKLDRTWAVFLAKTTAYF